MTCSSAWQQLSAVRVAAEARGMQAHSRHTGGPGPGAGVAPKKSRKRAAAEARHAGAQWTRWRAC